MTLRRGNGQGVPGKYKAYTGVSAHHLYRLASDTDVKANHGSNRLGRDMTTMPTRDSVLLFAFVFFVAAGLAESRLYLLAAVLVAAVGTARSRRRA